MDAIREVVSLQRRHKNNAMKRHLRHHQENVVPAGLSETLKILEPTSKKLTSIDSQRIMSVLVDCIQRIELTMVLSHLSDNYMRFKTSLGIDLVRKIREHKVLTQAFDDLKVVTTELLEEESANSTTNSESTEGEEPVPINQLTEGNSSLCSFRSDIWASVSTPSLTKAQVAVNNLQLLAEEIQNSCRNLLRIFYRNPTSRTVLSVVVKEFTRRPKHTKRLLSNLYKLKDLINSRLLMTSIEEAEKNKYVSEVFERERRNNAHIEKLQKSLKASNDEMQAYINKKNDSIHKIQDDLDHVENQADEHYRRTRTEAEKQIVADLQMNDSRMTRLKAEQNSLGTNLRELVLEHRDSELDLRKRKYKTETELENWIHKYDYDMEIRNTECEEIESVYVDERVQLKELEEEFRVMEDEYNAIIEERRLKQEAETKARIEFSERLSAARIIQRFWKRYGSTPKKKKKKGGKDKKKKK